MEFIASAGGSALLRVGWGGECRRRLRARTCGRTEGEGEGEGGKEGGRALLAGGDRGDVSSLQPAGDEEDHHGGEAPRRGGKEVEVKQSRRGPRTSREYV